MTQASQNDTVRVHYSGTLDDGTPFDSSAGRDPLEFTIGAHMVIPGFERAVMGMSPGEHKVAKVPASMGYGPFRDDLVQEIDRTLFPAGSDLAVGQKFRASSPDHGALVLTIVEIEGNRVTVDGNHPLAGKNLVFEIELVEIV